MFKNGDIILDYVPTKNQLDDILTKPLEKNQFTKIRIELGIIEI